MSSCWYQNDAKGCLSNVIVAYPFTFIDDLLLGIIYRDIRTRYNLRYMAAFSRLAAHLLNVWPIKVNVKELQEMFNIGSFQTMEN